jgi:hypothetical protein
VAADLVRAPEAVVRAVEVANALAAVAVAAAKDKSSMKYDV